MENISIDDSFNGERFDFGNEHIFQVEGNSMESYGFMDGAYVGVVPVTYFEIGDVVAFSCTHEKCDGAYIKTITKKEGECYWLEGRKGVWTQDGSTRISIDSRTTFGWLCDDQIDIFGVVFLRPNVVGAM